MSRAEEKQEKNTEKEQSEREAFDKGILLLNTGAIGASFLLVNALSKPGVSAEEKSFLFFAWCTFAISAISTVTSHYVSSAAHKADRTKIEKERVARQVERALAMRGHGTMSLWDRICERMDQLVDENMGIRFLSSMVVWLNRLSLFSFFAGAAFLLWFAGTNLEKL